MHRHDVTVEVCNPALPLLTCGASSTDMKVESEDSDCAEASSVLEDEEEEGEETTVTELDRATSSAPPSAPSTGGAGGGEVSCSSWGGGVREEIDFGRFLKIAQIEKEVLDKMLKVHEWEYSRMSEFTSSTKLHK